MPSSDMDTERPKSRESGGGSVLTENTDDFIIGDRVWVNGTKPGYIQYLGETRFSPGDWAGVVLDDHSGKNDGTVAGVHYFQCEPRRGVFARLHKLTRYPLLHAAPSPTESGHLDSCSLSPTPPPQRCLTPTRTPSPGARALREGDRVTVTSATGPQKTGVLRYLGHTDFAAGEWAGVELDDPLGKNDGTVAGKRYFRCPPNFGLFSPAHKVSRITGSLDRHRRTHMDSETENASQPGTTPSSQDTQKLQLSEDSGKRAQRLGQLLEAAEAARKDLASKLEEERKKVEELEFRIEEECIGKDDLEAEREKERRKIDELQRKLDQETRKNEMAARGVTPDSILKDETKRLNDEAKALREKLRQAEMKIHELQTMKQPPPQSSPRKSGEEEVRRKEEALLQAQLSLDNKKREVQNLLDRMAELEKELEKSKARQARQLDAIDDLNVKLQKFETKCVNLGEELHASKEKTLEMERRLQSSRDQVVQLEQNKKRLEQQLLTPESTPKEQQLLARLQEKDRESIKWRSEAEGARLEVDRLRESREQARREAEEKARRRAEEHAEEMRREKKRSAESSDQHTKQIRDLERRLSSLQDELEASRGEAEARLSRQEARLQEAELRGEGETRLREQVGRLQADRDLLRVEKDEAVKRLQLSDQSRSHWESEASRASSEVDLLKSQVHHLRAEFTTHRQDLMEKLKETRFDAEVVQDLHLQIEEQRRIVEEMQHRLKYTEGERDQLQTKLTTTSQDKMQVENGLKQEMETLKRR